MSFKRKYASEEYVDEKIDELHPVSWDELEDKPFGDESVVLFDWDGDASKAETVTVEGLGIFARISDGLSMTAAEVKTLMETGEPVVVTVDNTLYMGMDVRTSEECEAEGYGAVDMYAFNYGEFFDGKLHACGTIVVFGVTTDNFNLEALGVTFPKAGMWMLVDYFNVYSCYFPQIKTIDPKFLPDSVKTHPVTSVNGQTGDVVINSLPNTTIDDAGKFVRVLSDGTIGLEDIVVAEGASF